MISRLLGSWGWGTFTRQKNHGPEFIGGRHWAFVVSPLLHRSKHSTTANSFIS